MGEGGLANDNMGGRGVKNPGNMDNVIYGQALIYIKNGMITF